MTNKGLNVDISEKAHKVIEKHMFNNNITRKDDAVEDILLKFDKRKV